MEKPSNPTFRPGLGKLLRRFSLGLGLAILISPISAAARGRSSSPRRLPRATPPWFEPGRRLPPPRPSGSAEASHPAIHGDRTAPISRLFPRAGTESAPTREDSMARHPAGTKRDGASRVVEVKPGDSLWSIAEERVGRARTTECWPKLYAANQPTIGPDPDHILPGQKLTLPEECR